MGWREIVVPARMERVAIVAPAESFRGVLLTVADAGVVEPERSANAAGEADVDEIAGSAVRRGSAAAILGWSPAVAVEALAARLRPLGGAVVLLPVPPGGEPPTLIAQSGAGTTFQPLVETYATIPYTDLNPSLFAGLAYVFMFGMMFGDAGHGALLLVAGLLLLRGRPAALARLRPAAPFVIGAGVTSIAFGVAYGEVFGPTGLLPSVWLAPLAQPMPLLAAAIGVGAALLAVSYALGTINRWREGGLARALVALSGIAGIALYAGLALAGFGWFWGSSQLSVSGIALTTAGLVLGFVGLFQEAGGRASGVLQAGIELFDSIVRLGTNTISFARLAAFGLTHAALGAMVWSATTALWSRGPGWWLIAALAFTIGNVFAFALEALIAGIQALRLEYYELFSRIFTTTGRTFRPWHIPLPAAKEP
jgi:V/A-type H+-transporting ATPase subunit I